MNLSDSEHEGSDWAEVVAGKRRGRARERLPLGVPLVPGALGLLQGEEGMRMREQQQQLEGTRGRERETYPKIVTRRAGFRHLNTCAVSLDNVKVGPRKTLPSDIEVNIFLLQKCGLKLESVTKVLAMKNRQEFWVSFETESEANRFEKQLLAGIDWGNGMIVHGRRMDVPSLHVKVRGAADDVTEQVV